MHTAGRPTPYKHSSSTHPSIEHYNRTVSYLDSSQDRHFALMIPLLAHWMQTLKHSNPNNPHHLLVLHSSPWTKASIFTQINTVSIFTQINTVSISPFFNKGISHRLLLPDPRKLLPGLPTSLTSTSRLNMPHNTIIPRTQPGQTLFTTRREKAQHTLHTFRRLLNTPLSQCIP